jgi:hypothetical protein
MRHINTQVHVQQTAQHHAQPQHQHHQYPGAYPPQQQQQQQQQQYGYVSPVCVPSRHASVQPMDERWTNKPHEQRMRRNEGEAPGGRKVCDSETDFCEVRVRSRAGIPIRRRHPTPARHQEPMRTPAHILSSSSSTGIPIRRRHPIPARHQAPMRTPCIGNSVSQSC